MKTGDIINQLDAALATLRRVPIGSDAFLEATADAARLGAELHAKHNPQPGKAPANGDGSEWWEVGESWFIVKLATPAEGAE